MSSYKREPATTRGTRILPFLFVCLIVSLAVRGCSTSGAVPRAEHTEDVVFGKYEGYSGPQYEGLTTQALYIPMRDGVKIAIDLMLPANLSPDARIPAILKQTRYWRAMEYRPPFSWFQGPAEFERFFTGNGYALVYADVRGAGASFGTRPYPWSHEEVADSSDIVDWIVAQPWSNGKVGTIGISYGGTSAEFAAVPNHPAVKAVVPQFADHDIYRDIAFPGGVPNEWMLAVWPYFNNLLDSNIVPEDAGLFGRLAVRGVKPVDADKDRSMLKAAVEEHEGNGDLHALAKATVYRDDTPLENGQNIDVFSPHNYREAIERSGVAVFSWGSWFDAAQGDAVIRRFVNYENPQRAVIGPWSHGARNDSNPYAAANAPLEPSRHDQWLECLRFFNYHLKDIENGVMNENELMYYTVGEEKWKTTAVWPPEGSATQRWYFSENSALSRSLPASESGADTYVVDFEATSGATNRWHTQMDGSDVVYPNRAEQGRRLLTYTSEPLTEDIEVTGYPIVTLYVKSTHDDGAFFVYLEDIDEKGNVTYVIDGQFRALHRKLSSEPPPYKMCAPYHSFRRKDGMPLVPGEIAEISFGLHPVSALIKKGHRIRVALAGHDKDTFARIPEEGLPTITVLRNKAHASHIELPVIERRGE